jgi:TatD DNase family protein
MIKRSAAAGVKSMIITGGSLNESRQALKLAAEFGISAMRLSFQMVAISQVC